MASGLVPDFTFSELLNGATKDPLEASWESAAHTRDSRDDDFLRPTHSHSLPQFPLATPPAFFTKEFGAPVPPITDDIHTWLSELDYTATKASPRSAHGLAGYPAPSCLSPLPEQRRSGSPPRRKAQAASVEAGDEKKMDEKEKHKVRQRQRRQRMTSTMDQLKAMIPECVSREQEADLAGNKKMKVDQTQLLEMTVEYIRQLQHSMADLQYENSILRACVHGRTSPVPGNDSSASSNASSPASDPHGASPPYYETLVPPTSGMCRPRGPSFSEAARNGTFPEEPSRGAHLHKRSFSQACADGSIDVQLEAQQAKQPMFVRSARVLMAVFVVGLIFYNPVSYPAFAEQAGAVGGRVLQSSVLLQSPALSVNWAVYVSMSVLTKLLMLMFWTFGAMLLDHVHVPSSHAVKLATRENDLGVKSYDRGDYQRSRRHFEKALIYLGRTPRPNMLARIFHLPLEMWRQVLHLLRIGLWCDGLLVHLRGRQASMLEVARSNHYLFTLNLLAQNIDGHSVLYFLVSLNSAESLYQKPPVLAEVYATVALAFIGLLRMPKAYQYLMGKAWKIVEGYKQEKSAGVACDDSSVENTRAYLLLLSSYGTLCDGNLNQVQEQLESGCDVFRKKGNTHMFLQAQFFLAYTHFLRGNYTDTLQCMQSIDVCDLGDPRISWWRELFVVVCNLYLSDNVTERDLTRLENLYAKVESHSTFAPALAIVHASINALVLLRLGHKDRARAMAIEAVENFDKSTFTGWIFTCSFFLSEVFFTLWEEETAQGEEDSVQAAQLRRVTGQLCTNLREVSQSCELARPVAYFVLGRYTLNLGEYERSVDYLEQACEAAEEYDMRTYQARAIRLMERAALESRAGDVVSCV